MSSDAIRVVLVDDHPIVRSGIRTTLASARDIVIAGEAPNGIEGVALVERTRPDVVLMDLSMAQMDGLATTREIVARQLPCRILILTMHAEEEYLLAAFDAGASGYLVKSAAERELVDAIRALADGDMYVQPRAARVLARRAISTAPGTEERRHLARLTDREQQVLRLIAEGYSAPDVGQMLAISSKTVDTYKQRIHEKLGLAGRPEYVRFALRVGLLAADGAATR